MNHHVGDTKTVSDQLSMNELKSTGESVGRSVFSRDVPGRQEMTLESEGSRPAAESRAGPGIRFRANDPPPDHRRDSSPINRLAGLFKNLAKF